MYHFFLFATGRLTERKLVAEDENGNIVLKTKKVLPVALVFGHKTGGANDIIPFIKKLDEISEKPEMIHNW